MKNTDTRTRERKSYLYLLIKSIVILTLKVLC